MQPNEDERILAALSHAGIVVNFINLAGMIATALIWSLQREKSRYVSAHALQSLVYQGAVLLIGFFLMLTWGLCMGLSLLPAILRPELFRSSPPDAFWLALIGLIVPVGFVGLATLYGLYGAFQVYRGRLFLYPLAGRMVRRELLATSQPAVPLAPVAPVAPAIPASAAPAPVADTTASAPTIPAPAAPPIAPAADAVVSAPAEAPPAGESRRRRRAAVPPAEPAIPVQAPPAQEVSSPGESDKGE